MNIALISSGPLISKKEATWLTLVQLAKEYIQQGHHTCIIAKSHPSLPAEETINSVTIYRLHQKGPFSTYRSLRDLQQRGYSFDVLHGFSAAPILALELLIAQRVFPRSKIIHTLKSYSKHFFLNLATPMLNAVHVTVPTTTAGKKLRRWGFFRNYTIIHSNIDTEKFIPRKKEELKQKYGFTGKKIIFYYGALRWEKGVDTLLQAMPTVLSNVPGVFVILAGRSQEEQARERYQHLARSLGFEDNITITFNDIPIEEYVAMADVVVLAYPTLRGTEGNPSCLLESLACKTPVVTTALPELQEIVQHEREVLMAMPGNPTSVAEQIRRVLQDPELAQKLAETGYVKAQEFATKKVAPKYVELYAEDN